MSQLRAPAGDELRGDEHVSRPCPARRDAGRTARRILRRALTAVAQMYPPVWEDRNGSPAEALVYRRLREETPDDWFAVHSVGLTSHRDKPWAELDFVVIGPFGVLCLEVKGGRITVKDG